MTPFEQITDFAKDIASRFAPEKIILFGSRARGVATPDSDVDLMVILDHETENVEKAVEIRNTLHPRFPLDLLVRRPSDITRRIAMHDNFIREIVQEGVVLYERTYKWAIDGAR
jgi:predicted nucleotidyltransferase